MSNKPYREIVRGKAVRRDYSKVSGTLELPNLVEIQTESYRWFEEEGIREVFEEIYPIQNANGNINLEFLSYKFGEPKNDINKCKAGELTYSAPLVASMRLTIIDEQGEVIQRDVEEVFLGDFPKLTPTGTFIINGAERVIVSQIVRSPGAYFATAIEDRTNRDLFTGELIPSRGTWLEFMTDSKKANLGRIINMSVDRKRKILSTILFKAIGLSLNLEKGDDAYDTSEIKKFLKAINLPVYDDLESEMEQQEFLNIYLLLYSGVFGKYEEIQNTLMADSRIKTTDESLKAIYENQRSDDIHTGEVAKSLMNAKFFDSRRYDLNKAGRYKTNLKLGAYARCKNKYLAKDLKDENGNIVVRKDTLIDTKELLAVIKENLDKGLNMVAYPQRYEFSHPDAFIVPVSNGKALVGRIVARNIDMGDKVIEVGTVLTVEDIEELSKSDVEMISVYGGIVAQKVKLTGENVNAVLNFGGRLYCFGRLTENGKDVFYQDELVVDRYIPDTEQPILDNEARHLFMTMLNGADIHYI